MKDIIKENWLQVALLVLIAIGWAFTLRGDEPPSPVVETVVMVDQDGNLNTEAVASVESVVSNTVRVAVAEATARVAQQTASEVAAAVNGVAANLMAGNVVIYRKGFIDAFEALVLVGAGDKCVIKALAEVPSNVTGYKVFDIDYCMTFNVGTTKPIIHYHDSLVSRDEFDTLEESAVGQPVFHAETVTIGDQTYSGYYRVRITVPASTETSQFYYIGFNPDAPSGDGYTLDIANGITGGQTTEATFGDKVLTFTGGILTGVQDVQ